VFCKPTNNKKKKENKTKQHSRTHTTTKNRAPSTRKPTRPALPVAVGMASSAAYPDADENLEAIITRIDQKSRKIETLLKQ